jgi:protein archease
MAGAPQGFLEFDHTADWGLHVWAGDLASLFIQSALGMNALCGIALSPAATPIRLTRAIHLSALDAETLLVSFLSELLYFEEEGLGFDEFDLVVHDNSLDGRLFGGEIVRQEIEIKAVTFHNLRVLEDDAMFQVSIVFDV